MYFYKFLRFQIILTVKRLIKRKSKNLDELDDQISKCYTQVSNELKPGSLNSTHVSFSTRIREKLTLQLRSINTELIPIAVGNFNNLQVFD